MSRYREAMAAYVRGHDRVWPVDRMRGGAPDPRESEPEIEWSPAPPPPSIGVGVARSLHFHKGPGTRRSLEAAREDRG